MAAWAGKRSLEPTSDGSGKPCGASQEQLAADAKVAMRHLGFIERGQINASIEVIGRIAEALDISPGKLFEPLKGKK